VVGTVTCNHDVEFIDLCQDGIAEGNTTKGDEGLPRMGTKQQQQQQRKWYVPWQELTAILPTIRIYRQVPQANSGRRGHRESTRTPQPRRNLKIHRQENALLLVSIPGSSS
jgi:hypothetical protein